MGRKKAGAASAVKMVGDDAIMAVALLKPNSWNPNRMTPFMYESLKEGIRKDGFMLSMKLLIWGKDENGVEQNTIIDGEHRWKAARELGYTTLPVVMLHGITETQATALTIKLDQKHGSFDRDALADLLQDITSVMDADDFGLDMGFEAPELDSLLHDEEDTKPNDKAAKNGMNVPPPAPPPPTIDGVQGVQPHLRLPLVFFIDKADSAWMKQLFKHPVRETELNNELFIQMANEYLEQHPDVDPRSR